MRSTPLLPILSLLTLAGFFHARAPACPAPQTVQDVEIDTGPVLRVNAPSLDPYTKLTKATTVKISGAVNFLLGYRVEVAGPKGVFTVPIALGKFSADVPLALNQVNTINFTTISEERTRSAPATARVKHDSVPPVLFIDEPKDQARFTTPTVDVIGRVTDALAGFTGLRVTVNPGAVNATVDAQGGFLATGVALDTSTPPKPTVIDVTAADSLGNSVKKSITVHHDRIPPSSPRMVIVSGNGQTGRVGQVLASSAKVRVTHGNGNPFVGKTVQFAVTRSNGKLSATRTGTGSLSLQVVTDSLGEAEAFWRLGSDAGSGNNRLAVTSRDIAGSTPFWASAKAGTASLIGASAGDSQRGEVAAPLPGALDVFVSDGTNGVLGVPVTFSVKQGGGLVNGKSADTVNTDATGHAVASWTLGSAPGRNLVEATFPGNPGLPVTFSAKGIARSTAATSFAGYVVDNASRPLGGATCTLTVNQRTPLTVLSSDNGFFRFPDIAGAGPALLEVDGGTATKLAGKVIPKGSFPKLLFDALVIPSVENSLQAPVKLPPLEVGNSLLFDNTKDVVLTVSGIPGLELTVKAGSMTIKGTTIKPSPSDPASLILSRVGSDQLPVPMADGAFSPLVLTLDSLFRAKATEALFAPPIEIEMPNIAGFQPLSTVAFQSYLKDSKNFEFVATAHVSKDGSHLSSDPGVGIGQTGFHAISPPTDKLTEVQGGSNKAQTWFPSSDYMKSFVQLMNLSGNPCKRLLNGTKAGLIAYYKCVREATLCARRVRINGLNVPGTKDGKLLASPKAVCLAFVTELLKLIANNNRGDDSPSNRGNLQGADLEIRIVGLRDDCTFTKHVSKQVVTYFPARLIDATVRITMTSPPVGMGVDNAVQLVDLSALGFPLGSSGYFVITAVDITGKIFDATLELYLPDAVPIGVVTVMGKPAEINSFGGGYTLHNVPSPPNSVLRPQITYTGVDRTLILAGDFKDAVPNGTTQFASPSFTDPVLPISIGLSLSKSLLGSIGATSQATVIATTTTGTVDVTSRDKGTTYTSSNPAVVTVDATGLLRAQGRGDAFITAFNEGKVSVQPVVVDLGDPLTTIEGFVQLTDRSAVSGATVTVHPSGKTTTTAANGKFSIPGVPTRLGNIDVLVEATVATKLLVGTAVDLPPEPSSITDAGVIIVAEPVTWIKDASGFWDVAANWSTGKVPGPDDDVLIDSDKGDFEITVRTGTVLVKTLRCRERLRLSGGSFTVAAPFRVDNVFTLSGGSFVDSRLLRGAGGQGLTASSSWGNLNGIVLATDLTIPAGAGVNISNDLVLETGAKAVSSGRMDFNGSQGLFGQGQVVLSGSAWIRPVSGLLSIGPSILVHGSGTIGNAPGSFRSLGTITADVSGRTLQVGPGSWDSSGKLQATSGSTLSLAGSWSNSGTIKMTNATVNLGGTFSSADVSRLTRTGGTVNLTGKLLNSGKTLALDATTGSWRLKGGTIDGGTVTATGGAQLVSLTGYMDAVTLQSDISVSNGGWLWVRKGMTLGAKITLASSNNWTYLYFDGDATLGGTGEVLTSGRYGRITPQVGIMTIGPNVTIRGGWAEIGHPNLKLVNQGTIRAEASGATFKITGNAWTNPGTIQLVNQGRVSTTGTWTNTGNVLVNSLSLFTCSGTYTQTAGKTVLSGGLLTATGPVRIQGGSLEGAGTITGNLDLRSVLSVGGAGQAGRLVVFGSATLTSTATVNLELGGLTAGTQYDQLSVAGVTTFAGTCNVALINSFAPSLGNTFDVVTYTSRSGTFTTINGLILTGGLKLVPAYNASQLRLTTALQ